MTPTHHHDQPIPHHAVADTPDCAPPTHPDPHNPQTTESDAPQPRVLWRGETRAAVTTTTAEGTSSSSSVVGAHLDVPAGTRVLVVEDVAGAEAPEDDSDG